MRTCRTSVLFSLFAFHAFVGVARANTVTGYLWHVPEAVSRDAIPANVPGGTPDVTFDVNSPLDFSGYGATVSTWLANGGAFNISENTAGTLSSFMDNGGVGTLVNFSGVVSVTSGEQFTVAHDDGLTLIINGLDLGFDTGPTAPVTSTATYTGPSGNFPFQLVYGECCGGDAVLQVDLPFSNPSAVPIPPAFFLFGSGLLGLTGFARRRHAANNWGQTTISCLSD